MAIPFPAQFFCIIVLILSPFNVTCAQTRCLEHEKHLLLELKDQLVFSSSHSMKLVRWNQTDDCCRWYGVECDLQGHVVSLKLEDESISGGLNESSSLFGLDHMEQLDLSFNFFSTPLPYSISNLQRLSNLDLSHCKFTGNIPFVLGNLTRLLHVDLSDNFFTSSISSFHFQALSDVVTIDLSENLLSGNVPLSIFALPSLSELDLHGNQFSWEVSEFPVLNISTSLSSLHLSGNRLESPIPNSFFSIQSLVVLKLSHNLFNETFQLEKILGLPNLRVLDLSNNNLSLDDATGIIPSSLLQQSILNRLDLSMNKIGGNIPSWIWGIGNGSLNHLNLSFNMLVSLQKPYNIRAALFLYVLDLHSNQLQGEMPLPTEQALYADYSNNYFDSFNPDTESFFASDIQFLSVANNSLSGPVSNFICNYTALQVLDLSGNNLSQSIPPCLFENLKDLKVLNLGRNNITGRIPLELSRNCSLRTLDLNGNKLVGEVPLSLENCPYLAVMNVGSNHIEDNFPCMLPSSLQVLVLRSNRFHGGIRCRNKSWPNLQIIDMASNNFSGHLNPFNLSSWRGMMLDSEAETERSTIGVETTYTRYNYRDEVTLTIKGLELKLVKIWPEFTSIDFSCNNFHGDIPEAIGQLNSLYLLNLSHNSLTGPIPKSLGKLRQLGELDLSANNLTGKIPREIAGLTLLQVMNVSHNKLVGKIPVGTQIQSFSSDCFEGNAELCGLPLNISCSNINPVSPSPQGDAESDKEIEWGYVFAAAGYTVGLGSFSGLLLFCRSFRYKYFQKVEDVFDKVFGRCKHKKRKARGRRVSRNQISRQ